MKRALAIAIAISCLGAARAHAQDEGPVTTRRIGVQWHEGVPELHGSFADFVDPGTRAELNSGLWRMLAVRIYAFAEDGSPIAAELRSCHVLSLLYETGYRVQVRTRTRDVTEVHPSLEAVISRCLVLNRVPVGRRADWANRTGSVYFAFILELEPFSPDQIRRMRRWLAQPAAGGRVGGEAFYGSFVSLFVNRRIGSAIRTRRFRSPSVTVPR